MPNKDGALTANMLPTIRVIGSRRVEAVTALTYNYDHQRAAFQRRVGTDEDSGAVCDTKLPFLC